MAEDKREALKYCHIDLSEISAKVSLFPSYQSDIYSPFLIVFFLLSGFPFLPLYFTVSQFAHQKKNVFGCAHLTWMSGSFQHFNVESSSASDKLLCNKKEKSPIFYSSPLPLSSRSHTILCSLPSFSFSPTLVSSSVSSLPSLPVSISAMRAGPGCAVIQQNTGCAWVTDPPSVCLSASFSINSTSPAGRTLDA